MKMIKVMDQTHEKFKKVSKAVGISMTRLLDGLLNAITVDELFEIYKRSLVAEFHSIDFSWMNEEKDLEEIGKKKVLGD